MARFLEALCYKRKVAGSIPDGVIVIFPSDRTVTLGVDSASNRNEYVKAAGA